MNEAPLKCLLHLLLQFGAVVANKTEQDDQQGVEEARKANRQRVK